MENIEKSEILKIDLKLIPVEFTQVFLPNDNKLFSEELFLKFPNHQFQNINDFHFFAHYSSRKDGGQLCALYYSPYLVTSIDNLFPISTYEYEVNLRVVDLGGRYIDVKVSNDVGKEIIVRREILIYGGDILHEYADGWFGRIEEENGRDRRNNNVYRRRRVEVFSRRMIFRDWKVMGLPGGFLFVRDANNLWKLQYIEVYEVAARLENNMVKVMNVIDKEEIEFYSTAEFGVIRAYALLGKGEIAKDLYRIYQNRRKEMVFSGRNLHLYSTIFQRFVITIIYCMKKSGSGGRYFISNDVLFYKIFPYITELDVYQGTFSKSVVGLSYKEVSLMFLLGKRGQMNYFVEDNGNRVIVRESEVFKISNEKKEYLQSDENFDLCRMLKCLNDIRVLSNNTPKFKWELLSPLIHASPNSEGITELRVENKFAMKLAIILQSRSDGYVTYLLKEKILDIFKNLNRLYSVNFNDFIPSFQIMIKGCSLNIMSVIVREEIFSVFCSWIRHPNFRGKVYSKEVIEFLVMDLLDYDLSVFNRKAISALSDLWGGGRSSDIYLTRILVSNPLVLEKLVNIIYENLGNLEDCCKLMNNLVEFEEGKVAVFEDDRFIKICRTSSDNNNKIEEGCEGVSQARMNLIRNFVDYMVLEKKDYLRFCRFNNKIIDLVLLGGERYYGEDLSFENIKLLNLVVKASEGGKIENPIELLLFLNKYVPNEMETECRILFEYGDLSEILLNLKLNYPKLEFPGEITKLLIIIKESIDFVKDLSQFKSRLYYNIIRILGVEKMEDTISILKRVIFLDVSNYMKVFPSAVKTICNLNIENFEMISDNIVYFRKILKFCKNQNEKINDFFLSLDLSKVIDILKLRTGREDVFELNIEYFLCELFDLELLSEVNKEHVVKVIKDNNLEREKVEECGSSLRNKILCRRFANCPYVPANLFLEIIESHDGDDLISIVMESDPNLLKNLRKESTEKIFLGLKKVLLEDEISVERNNAIKCLLILYKADVLDSSMKMEVIIRLGEFINHDDFFLKFGSLHIIHKNSIFKIFELVGSDSKNSNDEMLKSVWNIIVQFLENVYSHDKFSSLFPYVISVFELFVSLSERMSSEKFEFEDITVVINTLSLLNRYSSENFPPIFNHQNNQIFREEFLRKKQYMKNLIVEVFVKILKFTKVELVIEEFKRTDFPTMLVVLSMRTYGLEFGESEREDLIKFVEYSRNL